MSLHNIVSVPETTQRHIYTDFIGGLTNKTQLAETWSTSARTIGRIIENFQHEQELELVPTPPQQEESVNFRENHQPNKSKSFDSYFRTIEPRPF